MLLLSSLIYDVDMQLKGCKFHSKKLHAWVEFQFSAKFNKGQKVHQTCPKNCPSF